MGACANGAAVVAGEPDWYTVTRADIDTWFSGFPYLFLLWAYTWVGREYSLPLLALLNPNTPAAMGWQQLVTSSLATGKFGAVGTLADAFDQLIQYHVFRDHCICLNPGVCSGSWSCSGIWSYPTDVLLAHVSRADGVTEVSGSVRAHLTAGGILNFGLYFQKFANADWTSQIGGNELVGVLGNPLDTDIPFTHSGWTGVKSFDLLAYGRFDNSGHISATGAGSYVYNCPDPAPPVTPGAVTTTGIPAVAAPSGTTSDQLMTQLLVQQAELRSVQDMLIASQARLGGAALVAGTAHASLSGDGEFACVSLAAVRVQLVGVPTAVDRWIAHPDEYSGAGSVSFTNGAGWTKNVEVSHLDEIVLCPVQGTTKVGYHFLTGITATITEYPS